MTDRIALVLGTVILAAILSDLALDDGAGVLFLLQKLSDLVEYLAFWR